MLFLSRFIEQVSKALARKIFAAILTSVRYKQLAKAYGMLTYAVLELDK